MAPNHEEAVLVLAPRLSRWRMLNLMGSVKKGKHVGIWGITSHRVRRVNLRPVDAKGVASDVPLELPTSSKPMGSRSSNFQPLSRGTRHKSLREAR